MIFHNYTFRYLRRVLGRRALIATLTAFIPLLIGNLVQQNRVKQDTLSIPVEYVAGHEGSLTHFLKRVKLCGDLSFWPSEFF